MKITRLISFCRKFDTSSISWENLTQELMVYAVFRNKISLYIIQFVWTVNDQLKLRHLITCMDPFSIGKLAKIFVKIFERGYAHWLVRFFFAKFEVTWKTREKMHWNVNKLQGGACDAYVVHHSRYTGWSNMAVFILHFV